MDTHAGVKNNAAYISLIAAIFAAAAAGSGWYHAGASLRDLRSGELEPLAACYPPRAKSSAFTTEADEVIRHFVPRLSRTLGADLKVIARRLRRAQVLCDRVAGSLEFGHGAVHGGGNYPVAEIHFPIGFSSAVDAESVAAKRHITTVLRRAPVNARTALELSFT